LAKIYDSIEIGLTVSELRQALSAWLQQKASIYDYQITDCTLHPNARYVVRFTVEPPLAKDDKDALEHDLQHSAPCK